MERYASTMIEAAVSPFSTDSVETVLRQELANGDAMLGTIAPILRHLLANDDNSVFGDEIVARVRGMASDLARQLLDELEQAGGEEPSHAYPDAEIWPLVGGMISSPPLLGHLHALALEWQLTERMQARIALDSVLPPLLQALIASTDNQTSALAMTFLASQSRFCQSQRRMKLPLAELPGDLLHSALISMRAVAGSNPDADQRAGIAESAIRARFDESRSRLGLIARLVTGMGAGAIAALSISHSGVAIFLSALAIATGQDRDIAVLATNETQLARLALSLRSAGLKPSAIEEQFLAIHPDIALPEGFDRLGSDRAASILAVSGPFAGV